MEAAHDLKASLALAPDDLGLYERQGYLLVRDAIPTPALDGLLERWLALVAEECGPRFEDPHRGAIVEHFRAHPKQLSRAYDAIRERPWLEELSRMPEVVEPVKGILGTDVALMKKIVFRVDVPGEIKELAHWHQDHFYVRGDERAITSWIPLQDTPYEKGPLGVMPGSHIDGLLDHDLEIGKRHVPTSALDREIRLVQSSFGDVLLFDSMLVHTSNVNVSDGIRYSIQARFGRGSEPVDPGMGGGIPV